METKQIIGVPFVAHVDQEAKPILTDAKAFIDSVYLTGGYHGNLFDMLRYARIKRMGYVYDFKGLMKRYVYKDYYGSLYEAYAPNKTYLRKAVRGKLQYIIELK
jgi:hypothetical protein